jgi:hypothetical protein
VETGLNSLKVAFGFKAHSGWAVLVVAGYQKDSPQILDRRRIELVEKENPRYKAPYHASENLPLTEACDLVQKAITSARRIALREIREAIQRAGTAGLDVAAAAVLMSQPMPDWSVEEILAVHFRMHKAEGVLFKDALARAAETCGLKLLAIPEKNLEERSGSLNKSIASLGKSIGPPWGKDQKDAALAALLTLS